MVLILTTQTVIRATRSQAISENRIHATFQFWVALVKHLSTLFLKCPNTFFKTDGQRFTSELSHSVPLCKGSSALPLFLSCTSSSQDSRRGFLLFTGLFLESLKKKRPNSSRSSHSNLYMVTGLAGCLATQRVTCKMNTSSQ